MPSVPVDSSRADAVERRYRQAGLAYGLLGTLVILVTVATPGLLAPERRADIIQLVVGLPVFAAFALAIAFGDRPVAALARALGVDPERAARLGLACRRALVVLVSLTAAVRTLLFLGNGVGYRPRVDVRPFALSLTTAEPAPRMLLAALLMGIVLAFVVRAALGPASRRGGGTTGARLPRVAVSAAVLVVMMLHNDVWHRAPRTAPALGWIPADIAYHVVWLALATLVLWAALRVAWPAGRRDAS